MNSKFGIVSYSDDLTLPTALNHQFYADKHSYTYILDVSPCPTLKHGNWPKSRHKYFSKIHKVKKFLPYFQWILWIDDDVIVTNLNQKLEDLIEDVSASNLVICNSPVNKSGGWTYINTGVFLIQNTYQSFDFLDSCLSLDFDKLRNWWDTDKLGMFTHGDQDAMTHQLLADPRFCPNSYSWSIVEFSVMNSRLEHYKKSLTENFILHLAGASDKLASLNRFSRNFDIYPFMIPSSDAENYCYKLPKKRDLFSELKFLLKRILSKIRK